jgi:hypothetical protein
MFSDTEFCYNTIEKKLLVIIYSLKSLGPAIQLSEFTRRALTDQRNLTFLDKFEFKPKSHFTWQDLICSFSLEIKYVKGTFNVLVDALLRPILEEKNENKDIVNLTEPLIFNSIYRRIIALQSGKYKKVPSRTIPEIKHMV